MGEKTGELVFLGFNKRAHYLVNNISSTGFCECFKVE